MGKRGPKPGSPYKYTQIFIDKEADALIQYAQTCETIPFLEEFASKRGYWVQYLSEWAHKNEKLSDSIKKTMDIQRYKLLILSLARKIDNTTTIFILKNNHGWKDKQELQHSGEVKEGISLVQQVNIGGSIGEKLDNLRPNRRRDILRKLGILTKAIEADNNSKLSE